MKDWSIEKKWLMIHQDRQAEMSNTRLRTSNSEKPGRPIPNASSPLIRSFTREEPRPSKSISSPVKLISPDMLTNRFFDNDDEYSPEFFIKKFSDPNLRSVTPKIAANLEVCLRTRSIE
jgi:hypothetical protein